MAKIYEKASETELKVISTVESVISLSELIAKKDSLVGVKAGLQNQLDRLTENYTKKITSIQSDIDALNTEIAEAEGLGIKEEVIDVEPVLEEGVIK